MINKTFYSIFQQGSRTYFYSSLFFPTRVKNDVFKLYGFVRRADNFVDSMPQDKQGFYRFKQRYYQALNGKKTGDLVIDSFVDLAEKKHFDPSWTDAFLEAMEMDLTKKRYEHIRETVHYMYGSAEVIGLYMAQILGLPKESHPCAQYLGRAMQYINFIRDISEDLVFGRIYFPVNDMKRYGIQRLDYEYTRENPEAFRKFVELQLARYCYWQHEAEKGYRYIPKRYLISVKTASDMYNWTAEQILKNPFVVYEWKVKPWITKIITTVIANFIDPTSQKKEIFSCFTDPSVFQQALES